jgi:hypothetical protein
MAKSHATLIPALLLQYSLPSYASENFPEVNCQIRIRDISALMPSDPHRHRLADYISSALWVH